MARALTALGNFLSGMETRRQRPRHKGTQGLGNFLSGMETSIRRSIRRLSPCLGNFLSGMETAKGNVADILQCLPWKLP